VDEIKKVPLKRFGSKKGRFYFETESFERIVELKWNSKRTTQ